MIGFTGSESTSTSQGGDKRKRKWREGWGGEGAGGDYLGEAIISNISIKAKGAINRGTAIIRGNTVVIIEK